MFVRLLIELQRGKVKVGLHEATGLARGLSRGLHDSSLDGSHWVACAVCVHSEADLDAFDEAFRVCFGARMARPGRTAPHFRAAHAGAEGAARRRQPLDGTGGTPVRRRRGAPTGIRVGTQGGGRSAVAVADARSYRAYRLDIVRDVRQIEIALRKLRRLEREGCRIELALDATIDKTAANAG